MANRFHKGAALCVSLIAQRSAERAVLEAKPEKSSQDIETIYHHNQEIKRHEESLAQWFAQPGFWKPE